MLQFFLSVHFQIGEIVNLTLPLPFVVNVILNHIKNVLPFCQQVHILITFILHYALLIQILVILAR